MLISLSASYVYAGTSDDNANPFVVKRYVGGDLDAFEKTYSFDNKNGSIYVNFDRFLTNEAGVKVFHKNKSHYGIVIFSTRTNSTNVATKDKCTKRYDVKVDAYGKATYKAFY